MSNLFTRQKRSIGLAYPLPGADTLLAIDAVNEDIQLDTARMAATAIISTESFDRDGDIVEQAGLDFENYSKNPVVFFNHQAWPLPIGKSEDESGRLTVQKLDHYTTATCYFSQNSPQAEQIYHLVADKTLRGTSIGFLVKRAVPLQAAETLGMARLTNRGRDGGYRIQAAEVTEWSWVGIGANPDAVLVHLQKGLIAGRVIDERLKLALEPFAAKMHGGVVAVPAEVEQIEKSAKYDPKKHPRGGDPKNAGRFSETSGSHPKPKKKPGKGPSGPKKPTDPGTQRYVAGMSIQRNSKRPLMSEVSKIETKLGNQMKKDKTIVESRVVGTMGRYGKSQEKSFFTQWTAKKQEHDPAPIISAIAKIGKDHEQMDVFISKVIEDHEDSPNARPGAEVRFRTKLTVKQANRICATFRKFGIDGFTMTPGPDHRRGSRTYVGMRVQVIPEFSMRFDSKFRKRMMIPGEVEKELAEKTRRMIKVVGLVSRMKKVESAALMKFDTLVIGRENYDEFIGGRSSRADKNGGSHAWFGQSIRDIIEKTASRLSPKEEKRYFPGIGDRNLHRGFYSRAFFKTKEEKEKALALRGSGGSLHRPVASRSRRFDPNQLVGRVPERFLSRSFDFQAPVTRFLKAIGSGPFCPMRIEVSPAWVFLKNLSRAEVGPLIAVGVHPRSHRHYCIKCKKCQKRIFACRCAAQTKPVKWSTCDPCFGARMVVKATSATLRPVVSLTRLVGLPKNDRALNQALKRIHKHHDDYDLTRAQALTLSIAAHAIQEQVKGHRGERWHRLSAVQKLKVIERVVNSRPEASSKQAYAHVFTTIVN